jgi:hypothetical protein
VTGQVKENLHHTNTAYGFGCLDCHYYAPDWSLAMPAEGTCENCHTTIIATATLPQVHHATQSYADNDCAKCHQGIADIDPTSLDCANCHAGQDPAINGSSAMHHMTAPATNDQCASCHTTISQASLDCASCHTQQTTPVDLTGSSGMHHATQAYADNACATCHQGAVALDCAGCHIDPNDPTLTPIPQRHHESAFAQASTSCADCHTSAATAAVGDCELCHVGSDQPAVSDRHHATPSYFPGNCVTCHEGIDGVSGDALDCATCHADKARNGDTAMHHKTQNGAPNYAVDNCVTCHDVLTFEDMIAADDCFECHTGGNPAIIEGRHHATSPAVAGDCGACHSVDQAQLDCASCHSAQPVKDGKAAMHHASDTATAPGAACTECHATVDVSNVSCASCHATQPEFNGGLAMHHATDIYQQGLCMTCHVGAESAVIDCAGCHVDPSNPAPISERHHKSTFAETAACTDCHTAVNTTELDCELCHAQKPAALSGSVPMHHDMTIAGTTGQCDTCHVGVAVAEGDCSACHTSDGQQIATAHHATPSYALGDCSVCHVGAEAQGIVCADCHGQDSNHHIQPTYASGDCASCHSDITLNGANCEACHTGGGQTIPEVHHAAPLTSVGGDCAVCHQSVSTPDVCANCHVSSPHHTTMAADYGLCENCHSWPSDKSENPQQASCRQCHGEYMHGKNGAAPIHDYRICFDCHGSGGNMTSNYPLAAIPDVFHARPNQGVGLTNPAPGKGTFNLFYSSIGGKDRSNYTDRYGDQERWERLDRSEFSSPAISYNLVQISEGGQTYQVPAFDNIPAPDIGDGGSTGGGTGLSVCASCHGDRSNQVACDNPAWTTHLDSGYVELATYQLAESTYLGSYCGDGGTTPPPSGGNTVDSNGSYFEAEDYSSFGNNFSERSDSSASGGTYLLAETNSTRSTSGSATSYELTFTETGTYYIWFLGNSNRSSRDNSLWYGVDGSREGNANFSTSSGYRWTNDNYNDGPDPTRISISSTGTHTINIWAREDGLRFDGFFLTKSSSASP